MTTTPITHLSERVLTDLQITTAEVINSLETLILGNQANTVWSAPKAVIAPPDGRYIMSTLAAMSDPPLVASKSLVLNEQNTAIGLPQINSLVILLHGETGVPIATIDGNWITAVRTAGLSALAAKYMANPKSTAIGFIGCGVQARSHLNAFADLFPLSDMKVFGRGQANIDLLCQEGRKRGLVPQICSSAQAAIEAVDLVVTSVTHTGVAGPFLDAHWLARGCFAAIADLAAPWHKDSFAALDRLVIDDLEQEASLPNKLAEPQHVNGDLCSLINGDIRGRDKHEQRTAFVFRGHALGDLALAALTYQKFTSTNT